MCYAYLSKHRLPQFRGESREYERKDAYAEAESYHGLSRGIEISSGKRAEILRSAYLVSAMTAWRKRSNQHTLTHIAEDSITRRCRGDIHLIGQSTGQVRKRRTRLHRKNPAQNGQNVVESLQVGRCGDSRTQGSLR